MSRWYDVRTFSQKRALVFKERDAAIPETFESIHARVGVVSLWSGNRIFYA